MMSVGGRVQNDASLEIIAEYIRDVAVFCLAHGERLYRGWDPQTLFKYLAWHFMAGQLVVAFEGEQIAGVFIAWRERSQDILGRETKGALHFSWQMPPRGGDALMIADVIISEKRNLTRLLQLASATWPDWKMRRLFTHRRGPCGPLRLVELSHAVISRFFHEQP